MITHRPEPTRHGMHCTCRVFCGRGIESWRAHRDDLLILDPAAQVNDTPETMWERIRRPFQALSEAFSQLGRRSLLTQYDAERLERLRKGQSDA